MMDDRGCAVRLCTECMDIQSDMNLFCLFLDPGHIRLLHELQCDDLSRFDILSPFDPRIPALSQSGSDGPSPDDTLLIFGCLLLFCHRVDVDWILYAQNGCVSRISENQICLFGV